MQNRTSLPHCHSLNWRHLIPQEEALLLELQGGGGAHLEREELEPLVRLACGAITVSTSPASLLQQFPLLTEGQAQKVAALAVLLQRHRCSPSCTSNLPPLQKCGQYFPKPPSLIPLVAVRPKLRTDNEREALQRLEMIVCKVQELLRQDDPVPGLTDDVDEVQQLLALLRRVGIAPLQLPEGGGYQWAGNSFLLTHQLTRLLEEFTVMTNSEADALLLALWHASLLYRRHAKFIPRTKVSEVNIASFNPWLLHATESNGNVELVTHTPEQVEKYLIKGSGQLSLHFAIAELEQRGGLRDVAAASRLRTEVAKGRREVSLMEGFFMGLDSRLYMSSSSLPAVVFVFLAVGQGDLSLAMLRYIQRPEIFAAMTFCQFLMWFREMRRGQEEAQPQHQGLPKAVVTAVDLAPQPAPPPLPSRLHLQDGTVMVKRRKPCPVHWAPLGARSDIVMFKVRNIRRICVISASELSIQYCLIC